ncbi:DUF1292 domain-containing protein [Fonticella tunisiensis]|uniref:UPF0473 protein EDD71_105168 n=1 Tax=Fonticella tunisiensis TaxID=1096341 RepID=A0A4R7KSM5_9CLOT|nr:DUF1292 domain-containing protein [Fonticella tunisiensis]TDT61988.1 uncharacterized protein DUF1292 [Fonticella tunisiensis]
MEEMDNVVVLKDENGVETEFEIITDLEVDGNVYYILYPLDDEESEEAVAMKVDVDEEGNEILSEIEDDEEFEKVASAYEKWLETADEEEFEDEE